MKVFLDDQRIAPDGWYHTHWPSEAITLLESGQVTDLSLDHDLGDDSRGTGYDVVLWIEEAVALRGFSPPRMVVHSANSPARDRMLSGIRSIERLEKKNLECKMNAKTNNEFATQSYETWAAQIVKIIDEAFFDKEQPDCGKTRTNQYLDSFAQMLDGDRDGRFLDAINELNAKRNPESYYRWPKEPKSSK